MSNTCQSFHVNDLSLYRCLASPTRVAVLKRLCQGEECVGDLAAGTGAEQTNVSHQLRELRACGLVSKRQDGKRVLYRLAHPRLAELLELGEELALHVECTSPDGCAAAGCC